MQIFYGLHFRNWRNDLYGGVIAAIVALPLALAFGVASGAGPVAGIWCAVFCGLFSALFGGTPTQISGPTGPLAVVLAGLISQYSHEPALAFTVVIMSGAFQILFGALKFGRYVSLIPFPVVTGFMSAIGAIIILMQLAPMLGHYPSVGGVKVSMQELPRALANPNYYALGLGVLALGIMSFTPRKIDKILPAPLIALVGCSILALFSPEPSPVIGTINGNPPMPIMPKIALAELDHMIYTALIIAFLGSMNSLLSSLVADNMTGKEHNSDRELVGQGIGNLVCGLFAVTPGAGATMRTAANIRAGGRTPLASVVHALILMGVVLGLAPLAERISYAVLGGILVRVGFDIIDWSFIRKIHRIPRSAAVFMLTVFFLTIFVNFIVAVGVGMVLASLLLAKQLADQQIDSMRMIKDSEASTFGKPLNDEEKQMLKDYPGQVVLFQMGGAMSFGAARNMARRLRAVGNYEGLVLDFSNVSVIDDVSLMVLDEIIENNKERKKKMIVFGLQPKVYQMLEKRGIIEYIEQKYIHRTRLAAMRHARDIAEASNKKEEA